MPRRWCATCSRATSCSRRTCRRSGRRGSTRRMQPARARRVADFIAGMTDRFALVEHARLFPKRFDLTAGFLRLARAHESRQSRHGRRLRQHLRDRARPRACGASSALTASARCRRSMRRASWSSRRATPRHGDMATNAAMVLAKEAGKKPRELAELIAEKLRADDLIAKVDVAGPGFINLDAEAAVWTRGAAQRDRRAARDYGRSALGAGAAGQRRIRLGQSDRADACRPLPRRGVRRCAREPARLRRLRRDARILHQRCRRAGRCARALGVPALPRGARRGHRRRSRKGFIRATISSRSARRSRRSTAARSTQMPEAEWLPIVRAKAIDMMMDDDPRRPRRAQRQPRRVLLRALADRGQRDQVARDDRVAARARATSTKAACRRRRARRSRTGRIASRRCSAPPPSATTSTAR